MNYRRSCVGKLLKRTYFRVYTRLSAFLANRRDRRYLRLGARNIRHFISGADLNLKGRNIIKLLQTETYFLSRAAGRRQLNLGTLRSPSSEKDSQFGPALNFAEMMTVDDVEFEAELVFQRDAYFVAARETKGVTLSIEVERKNDGCRWRGDFTSRYIEEITQRVGNLKNFKTFVEMLKCAFHRKSTALHVDLLTYHDLEKLTVRRGAADSQSIPSCRRTLASDKRYLILTYITEFDRVHYPLPLIYEEDADPAALKRCIRRLRSELDYMKAIVRKSEASPFSPEVAAKNLDQDCKGDPIDEGDSSVDELTTLKRTIMKLMKKNSMLIDAIRRAKEVEQRMSIKLQDQALDINLLKRRLSVRGVRDVSPATYRNATDISPARSRSRIPPQSPSPSRPRLSKSPSFDSRSSSASRKLASPSFSSLPGSRSSSCPGFRPKCSSVPNSPRQRPPLHTKRIPTKVIHSLPMDARDPTRNRSPRPSGMEVPRPPLSSSSNESSENYRPKPLSDKRAEDEKAEKWSGRTPPGMRTVRGMSIEVEEIDSRLYALCNFLRSSHEN